ncbi:occlusion-derived virus envelope protein 18 [Helicoverpa armigera NPV NNg1]|uniref:Occlusion derived virus envelope protein 18 n=5 Tax=Alphabaculovirus helarmigerae TaxID=3047947 RepID=Q77KA2_9ABAC|nr:odv-e18 [Helicoverpa armigera nucleopolyhedrovirus]AAB54097.1 AcMNPV ODV E18 homolog [Helicoverpa zea single nucleopolyhedrovirus]AEN03935.1 occlusion-derived virus envelope protein ODV-E18 [Helicoverpa armigera NPV strain Australia]AIG63052.2 ODV-E18 [Helicoverpa SNPV AC53]AIG63189.2 ODV-E18 [Helicoverpa armigera SNPV]AXR98001.1 odv-e18 [Helicoverpa assulta nucleopolyhedrovirus]BAG74575.1 occlusion-derived virus envelope protein 18 [Helicoverpa armigera NPV NNg1]
MDDLRGTTTTGAGRFNPNMLNPSMLMTILIALVIIILLIMLFQSSSPGSKGADTNAFAFQNPLNATMRNNPFVNTPQRTMM